MEFDIQKDFTVNVRDDEGNLLLKIDSVNAVINVSNNIPLSDDFEPILEVYSIGMDNLPGGGALDLDNLHPLFPVLAEAILAENSDDLKAEAVEIWENADG